MYVCPLRDGVLFDKKLSGSVYEKNGTDADNCAGTRAELRAVARAEFSADNWHQFRNRLQKWVAETVQNSMQFSVQYFVQIFARKMAQIQRRV